VQERNQFIARDAPNVLSRSVLLQQQ